MKDPAPQVSIVIPMYNAEKYIRACIESILQQTFRDFELIVVDDCSSDLSAEIVRSFDDPRIKLVQKSTNSGESDTRNFGLNLARGEFVYIMDDDDIILPQTLESLHWVIKDSQAEIVYMNTWYEADEDFKLSDKMKVIKHLCRNPEPREISQNLMDRLRDEYMRRDVEVPPWIKIQRRDFLLRHGICFPPVTRDGDGLFNFAELCHVQKALVVDYAGYIHRNYPQQTGSQSVEHIFQQAISSLPEAIRYMEEILDSNELLRTIASRDRADLLMRQVIHMIKVFICRSYLGEIEFEKVEEIVTENLSTLSDKKLLRTIFHALASQILLYEENRTD